MRGAEAGERRRLAQRQQVVAQGGLGARLALASLATPSTTEAADRMLGAMHGLTVLGFALEAFGVLVTGNGIIRAVRGQAPGGQKVWSPVLARISSGAHQALLPIETFVRRLIGRPRDRQIVTGDAAIAMDASIVARGHASYGRLQRLWDHEGALLQLHDRTNELRKMLSEVRYAGLEEAKGMRDAFEALGSRVDQEIEADRAERRARAFADSQWQFWGLVLITAGLSLQLVGQALSRSCTC